MSDAGGKTTCHPVPCSEFLHAWPCLAWQTTYASFAIKRAFPSHCLSTVKQHCGSNDEMDQFWGKTSAKGAMQMEYVIFFEHNYTFFIFFPPFLTDRVNAAHFFTSNR
jgi:hypothetical protein